MLLPKLLSTTFRHVLCARRNCHRSELSQSNTSQEFCISWATDPSSVSDILISLLESCNQTVRNHFLTLGSEPEESPGSGRKKKLHQRNHSAVRYEEFALWSSEILDSTGLAISLPHLINYLERFANDKIAYTTMSEEQKIDSLADDVGTTPEFKRKQQLRSSWRNRKNWEELAGTESPDWKDGNAHESLSESDLGNSGSKRSTRKKLSTMFSVYAHLTNLADLKANVGAAEVEQIYSVICWRPYHQSPPSSPAPSQVVCSITSLILN